MLCDLYPGCCLAFRDLDQFDADMFGKTIAVGKKFLDMFQQCSLGLQIIFYLSFISFPSIFFLLNDFIVGATLVPVYGAINHTEQSAQNQQNKHQ
jgi:hypothetical protein